MMQLMNLVTTTLGVILLSGAQTVASKELNFSMSINGMDYVGTNDNVVVTFVDKDGRELYRETRQGVKRRWKSHIFRTGELSNEDINSLGRIEVGVEGGDGLVIDYAWAEARVVGGPPSNEKIATWGVFDEMGWCLSKDPGDADYDFWSGLLVGNQCKPGYSFHIDPNEVVAIEKLSMSPTMAPSASSSPTMAPSARPSSSPTTMAPSVLPTSFKPTMSSCTGPGACSYAIFAEISSNSCRGDSSCSSTSSLIVEEGSCHGINSCSLLLQSQVGPSSCIGEGACHGSVYEGPNKYFMQRGLNVHQGSCVGHMACADPGKLVIIGKNSCNCDRCCEDCKHNALVPDNACNEHENGEPVIGGDFMPYRGKNRCIYCDM